MQVMLKYKNKLLKLSWAKEEGHPGSHLRQLSLKFLKVHEALRLVFIFRKGFHIFGHQMV